MKKWLIPLLLPTLLSCRSNTVEEALLTIDKGMNHDVNLMPLMI